MSGQLVDSTLVAAPKQRNTDDEKKAVKAGKPAGEIWRDNPAKARQKDVDARWTVQFGKAKMPVDGGPAPPDVTIPSFGYKNHAGIDKGFRFIRRWDVTDAALHDGRMLRRGLLDKDNTGSGVWADSAYLPKANEAFLTRYGFVSHVHYRKPKGRPLPRHMDPRSRRPRAEGPRPLSHPRGPRRALSLQRRRITHIVGQRLEGDAEDGDCLACEVITHGKPDLLGAYDSPIRAH